MGFVLKIDAMKRSRTAIYKALVNALNEGKQPLIADIAQSTQYEERQVRRVLAWLEKWGFIRVDRKHKYNQYEILR